MYSVLCGGLWLDGWIDTAATTAPVVAAISRRCGSRHKRGHPIEGRSPVVPSTLNWRTQREYLFELVLTAVAAFCSLPHPMYVPMTHLFYTRFPIFSGPGHV